MNRRRSFALRWPAARGALLALAAAMLFGLSTPLLQRFGAGIGPLATAALLYAGAAVVGALSQRPPRREARLAPGDLPRLAAVAACGAVVGPVALAWGLQRTSAVSASLMLTLEAVFTALLARALVGEAIGRRVAFAIGCVVAGAVLLVLDQRRHGDLNAWGLVAVGVATVAWALDNTLSRALAERDPSQVVLAKGALGAAATASLATLSGEALPDGIAALGLVAVGAIGYGASLRLYLLAQRSFGATRAASVFALAPFIGAAVAVARGERAPSRASAAAGAALRARGVLHVTETHAHAHRHEPLEHEHAHRHDDGHHDHPHDAMPAGEHSHAHRHEPRTHAHPHVPDAHHTHRH